MATFGLIEFYGIAVDRDIVIHHGTDDDTLSSDISLSSIDVEEEKVTRPPLYPPLTLSVSPPPSSPADIVPEDIFLRGDATMRGLQPSVLLGGPGSGQTPLERFASVLHRHEKIALAMTLHTRIQLPYQDFVPCPGSGPGSPALSIATDYIRPAAPPPIVEPPLPQLPAAKLALHVLADINLPNAGPSPMSRFLTDSDHTEWFATWPEKTPSVLPTIELDDDFPRQHTPASRTSITLNEVHRSYVDDPVPSGIEPDEDDFGFFDDASTPKLLKRLGEQRHKRVMNERLPRAHRQPKPRKRESPPQKKRKVEDDG